MTWETLIKFSVPALLGMAGGFLSPWLAAIIQRVNHVWTARRTSHDQISDGLAMATLAAEKLEDLSTWHSPEENRREQSAKFNAGMDTVRLFAVRGNYLVSAEVAAVLREIGARIYSVFEAGFPGEMVWGEVAATLKWGVDTFNKAAKADRSLRPHWLQFRRVFKQED